MHTTNNRFPRDVRTGFARSRVRVYGALVVLVLTLVGLCHELFFGSNRQSPALWFLALGGVMVLTAFLDRCPACGGGSALSRQWRPRWCALCGSQLTDEPASRELHEMVRYATDRSSLTPPRLLRIIEDSPDRFAFRFRQRRWLGVPFMVVAVALNLTVRDPLGLVGSALSWLVGLGLLLRRADRFTFARGTGTFQIRRHGLTRANWLEYDLNDIEQFGVTRTMELTSPSENDAGSFFGRSEGRMVEVYGVAMRLKSGATIYLNGSPDSLGYEKKLAVGNRLETCRRSWLAAAVADSGSPAPAAMKPCAICSEDCSNDPRYQDADGRYYHQRCYDAR